MSKIGALAVALFLGLCVGPAIASTNPDTPTALPSNIILGAMRQDGTYNQYFTFKAGPGEVKMRLTIRPNSDGAVVNAELQDEDGNSLAKIGDGTSNGKDVIKTTTFQLNSAKTLVLHVSGNANFYGKTHPTYRVQLDGAVQLDKTAKPLHV